VYWEVVCLMGEAGEEGSNETRARQQKRVFACAER
jgi:hypothetical protein